MLTRRSAVALGVLLGAAVVAAGIIAFQQGPAIAANGLLHPWRNTVVPPPPDGWDQAKFSGAGITLSGWRCHSAGEARATVILFHGIADNRGSWRGAIGRLRRNRFDVIAYDSRANDESEGSACTYGFYEKQDLHRVIDTLSDRPVVLIGTSLGAAVALQEAAEDPRVVAASRRKPFPICERSRWSARRSIFPASWRRARSQPRKGSATFRSTASARNERPPAFARPCS